MCALMKNTFSHKPIHTHSHSLTHTHTHTHRILRGRRYSDYPNVVRACEEMLSNYISSPFLLALLVDVFEEDGREEKIQEAVKVSH